MNDLFQWLGRGSAVEAMEGVKGHLEGEKPTPILRNFVLGSHPPSVAKNVMLTG